ncbi:MAG: tetratricopeptide repeat protein, partial [Verrucomicrobiales bacterium]
YQLGQRHGVPIITSTVAVNLTHSAPFVSLRDERLTAAQPEQWENHHTRGVNAAQAGDHESARTAFTQALKIDPGHAETQFRLGKLWGAPAIEHFSKARDLDALRFRADSRINDVIRKTATSAGEEGIHFIDLAENLFGGELFHEHVHFTFMGNFSLARQFASVAAEVFGFKRDAPQITQDECARQLGLTFFHRHEITKNMRHRLNQPPFSTQMDCKERDQNLSKQITVLSLEMTPTAGQQSITSFEKLIAERPQDWLLRRQFALMLASMGKLDRAIDQWQAIIKQMPHDPVGHQQLGSLHNRLKQWDKAEPFLRQSIALREINPQAWNSLGICLSHGEKINESYDCFASAVEIMPKNGEALTNWGLVLANQDRVNDAQQKYKEATKADSNYVPAFQNLGQLLTKQGQFVKAEHAYKR